MKSLFKKLRTAFLGELIVSSRQSHDLHLLALWQRMIRDALNPLNKAGAKYFSQNEEDGITLEILKRMGLSKGTFVEFGVGNGSENNTLILLASGWRGLWVGGEDLFFRHESAPPRFCFLKRWVDRDTVLGFVREGLKQIERSDVDVLSLDLDGNDIYLIEELLKGGVKPKLYIVEYNAKFPPPIRWRVEYNKSHVWRDNDYFGASLASFDEVFGMHGYTLICCNFSGSNAFFVRNDLLGSFDDVPRDLPHLYYGPKYYLFRAFGQKASPRTIEAFLRLPPE